MLGVEVSSDSTAHGGEVLVSRKKNYEKIREGLVGMIHESVEL